MATTEEKARATPRPMPAAPSTGTTGVAKRELTELDLETMGFTPTTRTMARLVNPDLRPEQLRILFFEAARLGLDPASGKQIYAVVYNRGKNNETLSIQIAIDGFRSIAAKTGLYDGGAETETDEGVEEDVTGPYGKKAKIKHPVWARATVWRKGSAHPFTAKVRWAERVKKDRDGNLTDFWFTQPFGQLEKCAEATVLRRAFPMELRGLQAMGENVDPDDHEGALTVDARVVDDASRPPLLPEPAKETLDSVRQEIRDIMEDPVVHDHPTWGHRSTELLNSRLDGKKLQALSDAKAEDLPFLLSLRDDLAQIQRSASHTL